MRGHLGIVQLIVERVENLDPQARGTHATPLHLAIHNGHKDTAQLLVSRGSDMSCRANLRGPGEDFLSAEEMMDKRGWDLALL